MMLEVRKNHEDVILVGKYSGFCSRVLQRNCLKDHAVFRTFQRAPLRGGAEPSAPAPALPQLKEKTIISGWESTCNLKDFMRTVSADCRLVWGFR